MKILTPADVKEQVCAYLKQKVDVTIYYNDENGDWVWAVTVAENPEWWLDAFKTKKLAVAYCKEHGLKVLKIHVLS